MSGRVVTADAPVAPTLSVVVYGQPIELTRPIAVASDVDKAEFTRLLGEVARVAYAKGVEQAPPRGHTIATTTADGRGVNVTVVNQLPPTPAPRRHVIERNEQGAITSIAGEPVTAE